MAIMFEGQVMTGRAPGRTVTVNEQEASGPDGPMAVQLTVLVPRGKVEPLGGVQTTVAFVRQGPESVGSG